MGRNEDFDNALWSQPRFEELSADASLLYIWSWTNPRCGMAGLYEVGRRAMTESKVTLDHLDAALGELGTGRFALYEEGVLWVVSRVKRLRTKSVQMAKAVAKDVARIDTAHPLRVAWSEKYGADAWLIGALGEAHPNLTRGSQKPDVDKGLVSLTRTSPEAHPSLRGTGKGIGTITTSSQGEDEVDARTLMDEACVILSAISSWDLNDPNVQAGVENAWASYPNMDLLEGCHLAVTWGSDPSWSMGCAATLRTALKRLSVEAKEAANGRPRSRRESPSELLQAIEEATG